MSVIERLRSRLSSDALQSAQGQRLLSTILILLLHCLLWLSLCNVILVGLMLHEPTSSSLASSAALVIIASICSLIYLATHTCFWRRQKLKFETGIESNKPFRQPKYIVVRLAALLALLWVCAAGWGVIVSARQPICQTVTDTEPVIQPSWQAGSPCISHRTSSGFAVILLLASISLFVVLRRLENPFESNLLGRLSSRNHLEDEESVTESSGFSVKNDVPIKISLDLPNPTNIPPIPAFRQRASSLNGPSIRQMRELQRQPEIQAASESTSTQQMPSNTESLTIVRSASQSSTPLAHPRPIRRIPSVSSLMATSPPRQTLHRRSMSTSSIYTLQKPAPLAVFEYRGSMSLIRTSSRITPANAPPGLQTRHHPNDQFRERPTYPRITRSGTIAEYSRFRHMTQGRNSGLPAYNSRPRSSTAPVNSFHGNAANYPPPLPMRHPAHCYPRAPYHRTAGRLSSNSSARRKASVSSTQLSDHAEEDEDVVTTISLPGDTLDFFNDKQFSNNIASLSSGLLSLPKSHSVLRKARSTTALGELGGKVAWKDKRRTTDL